MDFCFILQIGCSNRMSQEGDGQARVCPRCHNAAVTQVKNTKCLEICCVPLVPLGTKHLYHCNICQWQADSNGPAPPLPQQGYQQPQQFQGYPQQGQMQYGGGGGGGPLPHGQSYGQPGYGPPQGQNPQYYPK